MLPRYQIEGCEWEARLDPLGEWVLWEDVKHLVPDRTTMSAEWGASVWNEHCGPLPKCLKMSGQRAAKWRERARHALFVEHWPDLVRSMARDPNCWDAGWATIDHLLRNDVNWLRRLENTQSGPPPKAESQEDIRRRKMRDALLAQEQALLRLGKDEAAREVRQRLLDLGLITETSLVSPT